MSYNEELFTFIENSPSMFHAVEEMKQILTKNGYVALDETKKWNLEKGKKYVVTRNGSSLIAFKLPNTDTYHYQIVSSHSDSPCFMLKPKSEINSGEFVRLNIEPYGGMLANTWFDRPLSLAGRIMVKDGSHIISKIVNVDEDLLVIPSLAIHMNRDANNGVKLSMQNDILPLYAMKDKKSVLDIVAKYADVETDDIIAHELFVYNRDHGAYLGADQAFIGCPKLDNLQSAFASMKALLACDDTRNVNMLCCFDNEEIGSGTRQGADSQFLASVMERIDAFYGMDPSEKAIIRSASFMVSCDNAHSFHPNYSGKADPNNQVFMNKGIVIKHSARKAYTSDAFSEAVFKQVCAIANVPVQDFVNHNEIPGGGTLGAISSSHVSIPSVDIGLAQLAMHSCYEIGGAKDLSYMIEALTAFYGHDIVLNGMQCAEIK